MNFQPTPTQQILINWALGSPEPARLFPRDEAFRWLGIPKSRLWRHDLKTKQVGRQTFYYLDDLKKLAEESGAQR